MPGEWCSWCFQNSEHIGKGRRVGKVEVKNKNIEYQCFSLWQLYKLVWEKFPDGESF